jgi:DNA-binding PadR family transcriptional regulator
MTVDVPPRPIMQERRTSVKAARRACSTGRGRLLPILGSSAPPDAAHRQTPAGRSTVSVRDGLLALLTLGPAYGLQLHAELLDRAAHRPRVNVGQIYSTLERLRERGLVVSAGSTDDGLPLHALTGEGRAEAAAWLTGDGASPEEDWDDVLDRVLLASSLSGADLAAVLDAYESSLPATADEHAEEEDAHPQRRLAAIAAGVREEALRRLLEAARDELTGDGPGRGVRGYALERPRRGRRASS